MAVVNNVTSTAGAASGAAAAGRTSNTMTGEDFMLLLMAPLRNQNPLEPMDEKDMMAQITQLNSLQELQKITAALQTRSKSSELSEASELIGKTVTFAVSEDQVESGVVSGVSLVDGEISLLVGEWVVPLEALITVE